jgi:hypothetical protein
MARLFWRNIANIESWYIKREQIVTDVYNAMYYKDTEILVKHSWRWVLAYNKLSCTGRANHLTTW